MPFKLKLKKSRHYSVVSKSLFVISVEILDGTNVECTLSSESTGQDCLDIVCQKLSLNQLKFFGLQYISCNNENSFCWLELDKPMKRQLDKHARALSVYLRVMYYVISGVRLITDEITRYHYFLQLKQDVIEGRLCCSPQQAVELASYSMQAEFGNFDSERHTALYLKEFQLFPKTFIDPILLESLTEAASRQHAALNNLPQSTAEEYYICACQKLDGYGEEEYHVKDKPSGNIIIIGIGLRGVSVSNGHDDKKHFSWSAISNVINHKKEFIIESVGGLEKANFLFSDIESAKNAWRFCVLQHMFFRQFEANNEAAETYNNNNNNNNRELPEPPGFQQGAEDLREIVENNEPILQQQQQQWEIPPIAASQNLSQRAQSTSCLDLHHSSKDMENLRNLLPSYRPAPDYETAIQQKYRNSSSSALTPSSNNNQIRNTHHHAILYSSQPEIHQNDAYLRYPDITHNTFEQQQQKNPLYGNQQQRFIESSPSYVLNENVGILHCLYKQPPPYPSVNNRIGSNSTPDLAGISQQATKLPSLFVNNNLLISGSSPDLVSGDNRFLKQHFNNNGYYQQQNNVATTTTTAHHHHHHHHHPVHRSHSYLPQSNNYENVPAAAIFNNNLLATTSRPRVIVEDPTNIKKVYGSGGVGEHAGKIIYCMPAANVNQILQQTTANKLTNHGFVVMRNHEPPPPPSSNPTNNSSSSSQEPIYENLPHPINNLVSSSSSSSWNNNNNNETEKIRSRAESINSAPPPDVSQVINHSLVNALQNQFKKINFSDHTDGDEAAENVYANIGVLKNTEVATNNNNNNNNKRGLVQQQSFNNYDNNVVTTTQSSNNIIQKIMTHEESSLFNNNNCNVNSVDKTITTISGNSMEENRSNSSMNSTKNKKKRWALLMGKSSKPVAAAAADEKMVKSATLKNDNKKNKEDHKSGKYRWSTGQAKFNPLPSSISKETMCQLLENKLADSQLFFEFDKIAKKKDNANFSTALLPENAAFNRFKDVLPYEENRIRLTPSKGNKFGYINASHITATVGSKQRFYIAAQGPTKLTLPFFWQSVWEAEVYLMIQLTDHTEDLIYLPDADDRCINIGKDYQVWWEFSQKTGYCITSKIRLCQVNSRRYRTMWHLHYIDWGDQGCPNSVSHFLGFLEEMQSVYQHSMTEIPPGHNKNPPILVHCTAGVGRTGLTILSDLLLYTVDHSQEVCIPGVVGSLRQQRPLMIQTIAQYRFVYSLLIHYLKQTRLI